MANIALRPQVVAALRGLLALALTAACLIPLVMLCARHYPYRVFGRLTGGSPETFSDLPLRLQVTLAAIALGGVLLFTRYGRSRRIALALVALGTVWTQSQTGLIGWDRALLS